jgi:hypothetical protein
MAPEVIVKSIFKKYCMSIAEEETDDDKLWNDSEEDGNAGSMCEDDKGIDCKDGDSDTDRYR